MTGLSVALWACGAVALACLLLSWVTREYSWVDRLWSVTPQLYATWFAYAAGFDDARANCMAALAWAWGLRLTFNFARKGGYAPGGEDYRWAVVRGRMHPVVYQVFNVLFIAGFQNALLLGLALPAWVATQGPRAPLGPTDHALVALFLLFLVGEAVADEQQWRFQTDKKARQARGETVERGFVTTGLFAYSRHPNFFCEQMLWWTFYALGVHSSAAWFGVGLPGAAVLTALFQGSTRLTEELSLAKYPEYADYQRRVSRLLPWFSRQESPPPGRR
jgi:steroid 5-alpha reductase family enzyme